MRTRSAIAVLLAALLWPGASAQAKLYQDVIRGFEVFGFRFSGEPNPLGDGWTLNVAPFDRRTGANFFNNRTYNLGFADLTLDGTLLGSFSFTRRGIPGATFSLNTGGQPLSYTYDVNMGLQDGTFEGSVLINIDTDINLLGFYDQTFQISNRSGYDTQGLLGDNADTFDYDIGPVSISGNVYADILAAVTQPFFDATGTENFFTKFSSRATRVASLAQTTDELRARIAAGEILTDEEMAQLVNSSILMSMLDPNAPLAPLEGFSCENPLAPGKGSPELDAYLETSAPEPATLTLMALAAMTLRPRRRRPPTT